MSIVKVSDPAAAIVEVDPSFESEWLEFINAITDIADWSILARKGSLIFGGEECKFSEPIIVRVVQTLIIPQKYLPYSVPAVDEGYGRSSGFNTVLRLETITNTIENVQVQTMIIQWLGEMLPNYNQSTVGERHEIGTRIVQAILKYNSLGQINTISKKWLELLVDYLRTLHLSGDTLEMSQIIRLCFGSVELGFWNNGFTHEYLWPRVCESIEYVQDNIIAGTKPQQFDPFELDITKALMASLGSFVVQWTEKKDRILVAQIRSDNKESTYTPAVASMSSEQLLYLFDILHFLNGEKQICPVDMNRFVQTANFFIANERIDLLQWLYRSSVSTILESRREYYSYYFFNTIDELLLVEPHIPAKLIDIFNTLKLAYIEKEKIKNEDRESATNDEKKAQFLRKLRR